MKARAQAKHVRQSPYKVRRVLDLVRGLPVDEARVVLQFTNRRAADPIKKVLDSAIANAEHNYALDADELFVAEAYADEGPTLKRWRPRARGRATRIRKRTSHITIVVADQEEVA
jgi:large subunit ribosomal protein L22